MAASLDLQAPVTDENFEKGGPGDKNPGVLWHLDERYENKTTCDELVGPPVVALGSNLLPTQMDTQNWLWVNINRQ